MTPREKALQYLNELEVQELTSAHYTSLPTDALVNLVERVIVESSSSVDARFKLPSVGCNFEEVEHSFIVQALVAAKGNQTRAAKLLCMSRDQIRYRMRRFGIPNGFALPKAG